MAMMMPLGGNMFEINDNFKTMLNIENGIYIKNWYIYIFIYLFMYLFFPFYLQFFIFIPIYIK